MKVSKRWWLRLWSVIIDVEPDYEALGDQILEDAKVLEEARGEEVCLSWQSFFPFFQHLPKRK
jgi:hypothetical protein